MKIRWIVCGIAISCVACMFLKMNVWASSKNTVEQEQELQEEILNQLEFDDIEESMTELFPNSKIHFSDCLIELMHGDVKSCLELVKELIQSEILENTKHQKQQLIMVLLLVITAAVFSNFTNVFGSEQISSISFFMIYLLLTTICLRSFQILVDEMNQTLHKCTMFVSALCPVYFIAVSIATGVTSAAMFYEFILLMIYIFQVVVIGVLLPFVHIYMIFCLMNYISNKEMLKQLSETLKLLIEWGLKGMLALLIGMGTIQGFIAPSLDHVRRSIIGRTVEAVPIVGDGISGIGDVAIGTAILIKNGIGVVGMLICVSICFIPFLKLGILTILYKLIAAITEPISDHRITGCVSSVGEGYQLLMKVMYTSGILFLIAIALVAASTS